MVVHCPTHQPVFLPRAAARHTHHTSRRGQCEDIHQHELTHGELPLPPLGYPAAMLSTRAQRRRETVYGWADLPEELVLKVLEVYRGLGRQGLGFSQASPRCGWKAVYDALVTRLVLTRQTTDEAMGMLVLRWCRWSPRATPGAC